MAEELAPAESDSAEISEAVVLTPVESAEAAEPAPSAESTEAVEPAQPAESVEAAEPAPSAESTEAADASATSLKQ